MEDRITDALTSCASTLTHPSRGRWELALVNGKALTVRAQISNDWLLFDAPVSDRVSREDLWRLLRLNATLPGFCKLVLTPSRSAHLRADVPLGQRDDNVDCEDAITNMTTRLTETCSSLKTAYAIYGGEAPSQHSTPLQKSAQQSEDQAKGVRDLCDESRWPFSERAAGRMMIELEVRDSFYQAVVEPRNSGVQLSVEIGSFEDSRPISRYATGALLLTTGAQVRLARPSVDEQSRAKFEVTFNTLPAVSEFSHALSALSVACALCGQEALALRDEKIAKQYIAYIGPVELARREYVAS